MKRATVTRSALKELVNSVLENTPGADVFEPRVKAVNADAGIDKDKFSTNPADVNVVPRDNRELTNAVKTLVSTVDDDAAPEAFKAVKTVLDKQKEDDKKEKGDESMTANVAEELIRKEIRSILKEAMPRVDYFGDPEEEEKPQPAPSEEASFAEIAKELGFSVSGAKQAVDKAMKKAQFVASEYEEADDMEIIVLRAMRDYIDLLNSSGELTPADVQLMLSHPDITRELDGFREYLDTHIRQHYKVYGEED